jgi:quinol monooxygenase YgiN
MARPALIVKFTCTPGKRDAYVTAMAPMFEQTQQESGAEVYVLNDDAGDADILWMFEMHADDAAFEAHCSSEAVLEFVSTLDPALLAGPPEMTMLTARRAMGD